MKFRQTFLTLAILAIPLAPQAQENWIVSGDDVVQGLRVMTGATLPAMSVGDGFEGRAAFLASEFLEGLLPRHVHDEHNRCGGFMLFGSEEAARAELGNPFYDPAYLERAGLFPDAVVHQTIVNPALDEVDPARIVGTIGMLEDLGTRHYRTAGGVKAANDLAALWQSFGPEVPGFTVETVGHGWPQSSVVATIEGTGRADEVVVLGGHLDSINLSNNNDAPGADDDASGIAVVTEVLRVLLQQGYKPERTLKFAAYAAEEVGLRGSREIAESYKTDPAIDVKAALQFDMTGHGGSAKDMYLITDYVSSDLNRFLQLLLSTYNDSGAHAISHGTTSCGYACSDHASWTREGIPAAFPFEALFADAHSLIHSSNDLLANIDNTGARQAKFAKLGLEFAIELTAASAGPPPSPAASDKGYVWANQPNSASYTPSPAYSFNSGGGPVTAERLAMGDYRVRFAGLGRTAPGGQAQITGYGQSANDCKIRSWSSIGSDVVLRVRCLNPAGAPIDDRFTALFTWP